MRKKNALWLAVVICIFVSSGCASYKGGARQYRDATEFGSVYRENGISVAAEALTESDRIKAGFYENLMEKDYYPIEVVVKNGTDQRLLVQKDQIELASRFGRTIRRTQAQAMTEEFEHNKMAYALLGFGIFSYMSADEANKKMASDWTAKELPRELIVNPNRNASGFIYVKMPKGEKPTDMELRVPVENLETKAVSVARIQL
jgi:hypothetical protein